ncbi:MAG: hypothetical protein LBE59_06230 [Nevskiaceae bacterium]|jgi:hypothetical protein|nr:hypothetical protein [Nevskiaceae bacterium]
MSAESAAGLIQVKVDDVSQLFNTLDPAPFRERDLDKDAEEFIVGWARELPQRQPIHIDIHVRDVPSQKLTPSQTREALNSYFAYREGGISKDLKALFRVGRQSLVIGLSVLAICIVLSHAAKSLFGDGDLGSYMDEGLIIMGWVANWKPIEIFLYDWWPLAQRRRLYRRLSEAQVQVRGRQ